LLPLSAFASDTGVSVAEVNSILREAAVFSAALRQTECVGRINISGIAAATGLPRGEISRILSSSTSSSHQRGDYRQQPTTRILAGWGSDPRFISAHGRPIELKIFGRGTTFDSLVRAYGGGIPTRAVLDEMIRMGLIGVRPSLKVSMNQPFAINPKITVRSVESLGDRVGELLSAMLRVNSQLGGDLSIRRFSKLEIPLSTRESLRRGLSKRSTRFLDNLKEMIVRTKNRNADASTRGKLTVLVLCQETPKKSNAKTLRPGKRRTNLRRGS
jgi:Family of unknown function (DUF6502)